MAVVSVVYALHTRYIIESMEAQFRQILEDAKKNGDTIDLNKAKLSPTNAAHLRSYYSTVNFINSEDAELDALLKSNMENARTSFERSPYLEIPTDPTFIDFRDILLKLKKGDSYALKPSRSNERQMALCVMLILKCPGVEWDVADVIGDIYNFVSVDWQTMKEQHSEYIEISGRSVVKRTVGSDGLIGVHSGDRMPVKQYVVLHKVLPADFGTKDLVQIVNGKAVGEWSRVVEHCMSILTRPEVKVRKLTSYLKCRKGV